MVTSPSVIAVADVDDSEVLMSGGGVSLFSEADVCVTVTIDLEVE